MTQATRTDRHAGRAPSEGDDPVGVDGPLGQLVQRRSSGILAEMVAVDATSVEKRPAATDHRAVAGADSIMRSRWQ